MHLRFCTQKRQPRRRQVCARRDTLSNWHEVRWPLTRRPGPSPRTRATVGCAQRLRLQRLRPPFCSDLTLLPRGRYVNLAELGDEDRENKLETKTVEYLVHGLFARSEKEMGENKNGRHGAWWVDLDKILATIAADDLKQKLQAFEEAQKATRDEAIAAAMERKEEAAAADD